MLFFVSFKFLVKPGLRFKKKRLILKIIKREFEVEIKTREIFKKFRGNQKEIILNIMQA